jgi:hypothetical protein
VHSRTHTLQGDDVDKPIDYTGDKTEEGLVKFLKLEIGLYIGLPGNVEAFDKLAGGFLALDKGKQEERLTDAEAAETSTTNDEAEFAKFYVKTMKKVEDACAGVCLDAFVGFRHPSVTTHLFTPLSPLDKSDP